jgi:hypothetical protein
MTATLPETRDALPAPLPRGIDWHMAWECIRNTAMLELNGHITPAEADRRIARLALPDLEDEDRNLHYEDLKDRLGYLSWLNSDDYDPMQIEAGERDLERLVIEADLDIDQHIRRLVGPSPLLRKPVRS